MGWLILAVFIGYILYGTKYFSYYIGFIVLTFIFGILSGTAERTGRATKKKKHVQTISTEGIDRMTGVEFERWCAKLLVYLGAKNIKTTKGSGDQGVDIIADLNGVKYAIQCKCYSKPLGNKPIQEVYAGMQYYHCTAGAVMTNQIFTSGGKDLAQSTGIELWDRRWLEYAVEKTTLTEELEVPKEEVMKYKAMPHVEFEEGMNEYEELYFDCEPVDPWIIGGDFVLSLVSREFDDFHHAEHLAKAVEKHFYAETEVKSSGRSTYYVYAKVRARNIRVNFEKDHFVVANWA